MVNIQFWLTYHPYYGENNDIGYALMQAQTNQIDVANFGVPITKDMLHTAKTFPTEISSPGKKVTYPILSVGTSQTDYDMATFVMNEDCCTEQELWKKMSESIYDDNDNVCDAIFEGNADSDSDSCSDVLISQLDRRNSIVRSLSTKSQSLHEKVSLSAVKGRGCLSQQQRNNAYKDILADVKLILDNPNVPKTTW